MATAELAVPRERHITFWTSLPFFSIHAACVAAFFVGFRWTYILLALVLYYVSMFFVTAGYHRYFSRRRTSPVPITCSLSETLYLYVPGLVPGRGVPLISRMPMGA